MSTRSWRSEVAWTGKCPECGDKLSYNDYYDADFCAVCDVWVSEKCGETEVRQCGFHCVDRPDKPSQVSPDKR